MALYARQLADLDRQVARLTQHAVQQGWRISQVVAEVGSEMNGRPPKLLALLSRAEFDTLVVDHRDRLGRFGFDYLAAALGASGRRIPALEDKELQDDLVRDMREMLTSICARLYCRRSTKRKAEAAVARAQNA